jgi:hypothetical protein
MGSYIKLSEYAKKNGICYKTAYNHWNKGMLRGKKLETGTILIETDQSVGKCVIYSTEELFNTDMIKLATNQGFSVSDVIVEKSNSIKFNDILADTSIKTILMDLKNSKQIDNIYSIKVLLESNSRTLKIF